MGTSDPTTPASRLQFLTIGAFPPSVANDLVQRVSRQVAVPCYLGAYSPQDELPLLVDRQQVDADALLRDLERKYLSPGSLLVGMTTRDLGVRIFTFVFGQARRNGRAALISLARLKPEFYGLPPDPDLVVQRAVAESLHELGHLGGLLHCTDFGCLMHFATNVESIDLRGKSFCSACAAELPRHLLSPEPHSSGR